MKTKTIISLFSISLLFFIGLFPLSVIAVDYPYDIICQCSGEIQTSQCDYFSQTNCAFQDGKCVCTDLAQTITITETKGENWCTNGQLFIGEFINQKGNWPGLAPEQNLTCEVVQQVTGNPCPCTGWLPKNEIGQNNCNQLDQSGQAISCSWDSDRAQCQCTINTIAENVAECTPQNLPDFQSSFCCTYTPDGTKTGTDEACQPSTGETPPTEGGIEGTESTTGGTGGTGGTTGGQGVTAPGEGPTSPIPAEELPNFLGTAEVTEVIGRVVKAVIGISGSAALAVFVYGGVLWMLSAGNPDRIKKGRSAMVYAAIGLAVIFLSYALVNFVLKALK